MPAEIFDYRELSGLLDRGGQLVEVLPAPEYRRAHLPGALNIPLRKLARDTVARLDRGRPVIVYCEDYQ